MELERNQPENLRHMSTEELRERLDAARRDGWMRYEFHIQTELDARLREERRAQAAQR